jgi:hypothetical protein
MPYTAQRFERLLPIGEPVLRNGRQYVNCRCDCGRDVMKRVSHLTSGVIKSCGCLRQQLLANGLHGSHRLSRSPVYRAWAAAKSRCYDKNHPNYRNYGGRGISMCDQWRDSFETFLNDVGDKPAPKYTLDRIDVDGDYAPGNCRWATHTEQMRNTRQTKNDESLAAAVRALVAQGFSKKAIAVALSMNYSSVKQIAAWNQWR